ncbi:hypothetical protein ATE47_15165 [Chryseobacterium sp. IHB B 17019]|jgi:hypothetical protein|uniref:hypothetical protein n=1 Tax=Chryseobacterium sp. IHB B 17019 TaxID=1721091 RepID=UPI0007224A69|nr:hypothetical protein [Chryseobacterium sp. IHB B 17019]ALR31772.1 hypothetical protein ATE47_15165 [Chryseobacterium sp. IHB B 17019]
MGFYSKFSEQDLIESYNNQVDYQGKPSRELLEEISLRGSLQELQTKIEDQKKLLNERNRIIREIHQHFMNKSSKQEYLLLLSSDILSKAEIQLLVEEKYIQIHQNVENLKVDSDTILYSFLGIFIASAVSSGILFLCIYKFIFLAALHFYLLIPAYIINYLIIKLITKKTRDNLAVFIASFIATVLNLIFFIILIN